MSSSSAQDAPMPPTVASVGPRFRPYASPNHQVTKGRYITSNDPRGYIPVYEYPLNGQWIMMDIDDGYILWTGIWKALGNSKADIVKMIDSQPDLAPLIRRVRGGYLKIQGTWMPYEVALRLARRVAWPIRDELIPLFGPTFPSTCLSPDQPGYGQVVASGSGRRRFRKANNASTSVAVPRDSQTNWTIVTPSSGISPTQVLTQHHQYPSGLSMPPLTRRPSDPYSYGEGPSSHRMPADSRLDLGGPSSPPNTGDASPSKDRSLSRYSPYPGSSSSHLGRRPSSSGRSLHLDIPALSLHDNPHPERPNSAAEHIILPPIRQHNHADDSVASSYALPPISALEDLRGVHANDSAAVLRRLKEDDESYAEYARHEEEQTWGRHRSLSAPPYKPLDSEQFRRSQNNYDIRASSGSNTHYPAPTQYPPYQRPTLRIPPIDDGSDTSPISPSPSTPRSATSSVDDMGFDHASARQKMYDYHRRSVYSDSTEGHLAVSAPSRMPYVNHRSS